MRESGAAAIEYVGVIIVAAALVLALAIFATPVSETLYTKLCQAFGAGCSSQAGGETPAPTGPVPGRDEDYEPSACMNHEESSQYSTKFKLGFIQIGTDSGFIVQQFADGRVRVTVTDGASIGATGGFGGKFNFGNLGDGKNSGLDVDFGGGLKFKYGDTWEFKDEAEYDRFKKQLDTYLMQQEMLKQEGGYWGIKGMGGLEDPPPVPQTRMSSFEFDLSAAGDFGLKDPTGKKDSKGNDEYFDPNVGVNVEIKAGTKVITKEDLQNGDITKTYEIHASGEAGADMILPGGSAKGSTSGSLSVTKNKKGEVTKIVFQQVREGSLEGHIGNKKSNPTGGGEIGIGDGKSSVVTTSIDVNDSNRAIVDDWLNSTNTYGKTAQLALPWLSMIPSEPSDNPFEQLLYEEGKVSSVEYHNVRDKLGFDISVDIGFKAGFGLSMEEATADAIGATYLGAPGDDGVRVVVPDTKCVK